MFENINTDFIRKDIEFRTRYSYAILNGIENDNSWSYFDKVAVAASNMRVVCSHSILLGEITTFYESISEATRLYKVWGSPYSQMLSSFIKSDAFGFYSSKHFPEENFKYFISYFNDNKAQIISKNIKLAQYVYLIFNKDRLYDETLLKILDNIKSIDSLKIGTLGIPVNVFFQAFSFKKNRDILEAKEKLIEIVEPILFSYDNNLKRAMQNKHHFKTLSMSFHPVDLDILSILNFIEAPKKIKEIIYNSSISLISKKSLSQMIDFINIDENNQNIRIRM